jgi:hypothetical protein
VRNTDGHEAVHEVKRDLGLRGNDVDGMRRRLREQGTAVRSTDGIEGYGGVDTTKEQTVRAVRGAAAQRLQAQYRFVRLCVMMLRSCACTAVRVIYCKHVLLLRPICSTHQASKV